MFGSKTEKKTPAEYDAKVSPLDEESEVRTNAAAFEKDPFAAGEGEVNFRTTGWMRASVFFIKMTFGIGVLSIPSSFLELGLALGICFVIGWGVMNTYMAHLMGRFKLKWPAFHALPDAVKIMAIEWGYSEFVANFCMIVIEFLYLLTWILAAGASMLGLTIALNAVSTHATCTVVFSVVSFIAITSVASIRKISHLAWVSWLGFVTIVAAIMIVVIAVAISDRPAAAPETGDFDLGFSAAPIAGATFASAFSAALAIFSASGNTPGYIPVLAEMKRPQDYNKALYVCVGFINAAYIAFSTVVFYYCGQWVSSPALGSAGPTIKIIAYAIAIPGLLAGGAMLTHIAGKSLFVRILRNSRHLTADTKTHWAVWLGCCFFVGFISWLLSEAIPFFSQLLSLIASLCFGPISIIVPAFMWFNLNPNGWSTGKLKTRAMYILHVLFIILGLFVTIAGTYAVIADIVKAFEEGTVGGAFSCSDNSNSVAQT